MVAEPEAAALYTMKTQLEIEGDEFMVVCLNMQNEMATLLTSQPGDCFVLCDAGGGTVVRPMDFMTEGDILTAIAMFRT